MRVTPGAGDPRGARLPASRVLAADLGCARGTVVLALEQLTAEGYLTARPGSATRVAATLPDDTVPHSGPPARVAAGPAAIAQRLGWNPDAAAKIAEMDIARPPA